jgi:predicted DNA-binding mobile mystery protein A
MTQAQLAKRLSIERQNVSLLEADERHGTVTLQRLRRAADALGCDLHYVLVPRRPLEQTLLDAATERARQQYDRIARTQALELATIDKHELEELIREKAEEIVRARPGDAWRVG